MKAMMMHISRRTLPAEAPTIASTDKNVFPGNRGVDEVVFELWKKEILCCYHNDNAILFIHQKA